MQGLRTAIKIARKPLRAAGVNQIVNRLSDRLGNQAGFCSRLQLAAHIITMLSVTPIA
jgi:hypothetical protein